jgi:hypothetical protein
MTVPKIVIIVPYRDRECHRFVFNSIMPQVLDDKDYKIFYIHQNDKRLFNRGAIKNIGFLYVKSRYQSDYKNITFVFNDIDCMPYKKGQFSYDTKLNEINHFYGFKHTLGGILAIKGKDYEDINGFPNIWTWGLEDNCLQKRCYLFKKTIKRNEFIEHNNFNDIIVMHHGYKRVISDNIESKFIEDKGKDGINTIRNLKISSVTELKKNIFEVNVDNFTVPEKFDSPFVKNARELSIFKNVRLNRGLIKNRKNYRGYIKNGKLGGERNFGKMINNKDFMLF